MKNKILTYEEYKKNKFKKLDIILVIKTFWFMKIWQEEKKEEYREIKPYYQRRLEKFLNSTSILVGLKAGYTSDSPFLVCMCSLKKGKGFEKWGAEKNKEYYILEIQKVYK